MLSRFWVFYIILTVVLFSIGYITFSSEVRPTGNNWGLVGLLLSVWGFGWLLASFVFVIRDIWPHCCGRVKVRVE